MLKALYEYMRAGEYRYIEALILSTLWLCSLCFWINPESQEWGCIAKFFNIAASLVAACGVVAYNLRNRVVDFSIRLISKEREYEEISNKTKRTCRRLTRIVFLSLISGIVCMVAGVYDNSLNMMIAGVAFSVCIVWYAHIIFAFDELEDKMLESSKSCRDKEEYQKRVKMVEESQKRHPDNF